MASRRRIRDKCVADRKAGADEAGIHERPRKSARKDEAENAIVSAIPRANAAAEECDEPQQLQTPAKRGSGCGLKSVQKSQEISTTAHGADGSKVESEYKIKDQRLYTADSNTHVETKTLKDEKRVTSRRNGTVIITESKVVKKVSYF